MQSLRDLKKQLDDWLDERLQHDGFFVGAIVVVVAGSVIGGLLLAKGVLEIAGEVGDVISGDLTQEQKRSGESHSPEAAADSTSARPMNAWPVDSSYAVAARGQMVYFGNGAFLDVADFSDVQRPVRKGRVALPVTPRDIALSGDFAYILLSDSAAATVDSNGAARRTNGVFGVRAVDVSDPSAPRVVGAYDAEGPIEELAVAGSHAYLAGGKRGLRVLDVSDPRRMREVGACVPASAGPASETNGVAVSGGYAYLAAGEAGLRVVDVSDPAAPSLRHTFHVSGEAVGVALSGVHAFLAWRTRSIKDPDGSLNSDWFDQGLLVFDVSRSARPKRVSALANGPFPGDVWAGGARVYFDTGLDGIGVFDVSEAPTLRDIGSFASLVLDVAATSTRVYLAKGTKGLYVWERPWQARSRKDDGSKTLSGTPSRKRAGDARTFERDSRRPSPRWPESRQPWPVGPRSPCSTEPRARLPDWIEPARRPNVSLQVRKMIFILACRRR